MTISTLAELWYDGKQKYKSGLEEVAIVQKELKWFIVVGLLLIIVVGLTWYKAPIDLMDLSSHDVMEIDVFNGNTGQTTHITDTEQIDHIVDNLNDVVIKRGKTSVGYMGHSFKITIYMSDGNEADGWNNYMINSADTIRKDPFFYHVVEGNVDYDYIKRIVN